MKDEYKVAVVAVIAAIIIGIAIVSPWKGRPVPPLKE